MTAWLSDLVVRILEGLGTYIVAQAIARSKANQQSAASDAEVDQKLAALKDAYKAAFNGQPVTKDDKKNLQSAISQFISGGDSRGL